jgi:hypothetical protein
MTTSKQVSKVTNKKRVATPVYFGETDPAQFIWQNKTHRSASEAFRDADYATAIWRCPNEWDKVKEGGVWIVLWGVLLGGLYLVSRFA